MGREVRRVSATWEHPVDGNGDLIPMHQEEMPGWSDAEKTHLQMYENTTEGTPISPVLATPEDLARWLADNNASAFASRTATYDQWLATIHSGSAPSAIFRNGVFLSGVEAQKEIL